MARYRGCERTDFVPSRLTNACDSPALKYNPAIQYLILVIAIAINVHTIRYKYVSLKRSNQRSLMAFQNVNITRTPLALLGYSVVGEVLLHCTQHV